MTLNTRRLLLLLWETSESFLPNASLVSSPRDCRLECPARLFVKTGRIGISMFSLGLPGAGEPAYEYDSESSESYAVNVGLLDPGISVSRAEGDVGSEIPPLALTNIWFDLTS